MIATGFVKGEEAGSAGWLAASGGGWFVESRLAVASARNRLHTLGDGTSRCCVVTIGTLATVGGVFPGRSSFPVIGRHVCLSLFAFLRGHHVRRTSSRVVSRSRNTRACRSSEIAETEKKSLQR